MHVLVKICGITSPEDALVAVEAGADAVGFMFYPQSPRFLERAAAHALARVLPPCVRKVGVFVDAPADQVRAALEDCGLDLLQFHGAESPAFCAQFGVPAMKAFRIRDAASLAVLQDYPTDYWLLDAYVAGQMGGTGERFNWDHAIAARQMGRPIFLAGGLTPDNVAAAVGQVKPFGVDVSSGVERAPGRKDPAKVRAFIAAVRNAERAL